MLWHPNTFQNIAIYNVLAIFPLLEAYQYVPHKALAEVSKIANYRRLVAVNHGSQSKATDGSKSGWRQRSVVVVVVVIEVAM